jgi:acyl carrier protein
MSVDLVRVAVVEHLHQLLLDEGGGAADSLADDCDLLTEGVIDSFGLLELLAFVEERFGVEVDFEGPDGDRLTELGPLCHHIAGRLVPAAAA